MSKAARGRTPAEVEGEPHHKRIKSHLAQKLSAHETTRAVAVSSIVLGVTNPEYVQLGLRFRDPFNSEKTATYYAWDKTNSSSVWPQADVTGLPLLNNTTTTVPHDHGPALQYTQFLFHSLMRRWIQEDKNLTKYYTAYRAYGLDGNIDFPVDVCKNMTEFSDLKIGGAYFDAGVLQGSNIQGNGNPYNATNLSAGTYNTAAINFLAAHEQVMAPGLFRGDSYLWNDGCSLAKIGTTVSNGKVMYEGLLGTAQGQQQNIDHGATTAVNIDAREGAANLCGSINIAHGATPLPTGAQYSVQIFGYNEGQPYELPYASATGVIGGTNAVAPATNNVFFSYAIGLPDYYRIRFATWLPSGGSQNGGASVRVWFVNTGEMWRQRQTPDANLSYASIQSHRGLATTLLSSNDTPQQYKGGRAVTTQLPLGQEWQTVTDGQDEFAACTKTLREKDKNFEHGHYSWLRIADIKDSMVLKKEIWPSTSVRDTVIAGAATTAQPFCFGFELNKQSVLAQCISAPQSSVVQSVQFTIACGGEYTTGNQWQHDAESEYTSKDWEDAVAAMSSFEQGMENEEHTGATLMNSIKAGNPIEAGIKGILDFGLPLVEKGLSTLTSNPGAFLPLLAAAL